MVKAQGLRASRVRTAKRRIIEGSLRRAAYTSSWVEIVQERRNPLNFKDFQLRPHPAQLRAEDLAPCEDHALVGGFRLQRGGRGQLCEGLSWAVPLHRLLPVEGSRPHHDATCVHPTPEDGVRHTSA